MLTDSYTSISILHIVEYVEGTNGSLGGQF